MNAKAVRPHKLPTSEREVPFLTNTPYLFSLFLDAILIVVVGLGQLVGESLQSGNLFLLLIDGAVKVLVLLQVAVGGRETARLRTSSCVERLPTKTQVVLLAAVRLVPKQDVSEMQRIILCRDFANNSL